MKRLVLLFAGIAGAATTDVPKIDYKLQFEARTLEWQILLLQSQYNAKLDEMRKICGKSDLAGDPRTGEWICVSSTAPR